MSKILSLKSSRRTQTLNSDTVFDSWSTEKIQNNINSLKTKAEAYKCQLRITDFQIQLVNSKGAYFSAVLDDSYNIENIEFSTYGFKSRSVDIDEITEDFDSYYDALNELKAAWRAVSNWLDLIAYAKQVGINCSRKKLNSSLDYDYDGEELDDGYFEGSIAGSCSGLSQKYAQAPNYAFFNDVAGYVATAADIISASQHNDNFDIEISAADEDEFEDTVSQIVEFLESITRG